MRESLASFSERTGKDWLLREWSDPSCSPQTVSYGSKRRVWWTCRRGHRWQAAVTDRTGGTGCPYCSGALASSGFNDLATLYPKIAKEWHPTKNDGLTPDRVTPGSNRKAWWRCEAGHEWQAFVCSRTAGCGCPFCTGKRVVSGSSDLAALFPALAAEWSAQNAPLSPEDVRPHSNRVVWWQCQSGHTWQAKVNDRVKLQSGCPFCKNRKVLSGFNDLTTRFPEIAAEWAEDLNGELTPQSTLAGSNQKVWWRCAEGHVWQAKVRSRTGSTKTGCPVCAGNISKKQKARLAMLEDGLLPPQQYGSGTPARALPLPRATQPAGQSEPGTIRPKRERAIPGTNDLASLCGEAAAWWDGEKNGALTPAAVTPQSTKKVWWKCPNGHSWKETVRIRAQRAGECPVCSGKRLQAGVNDLETLFPALAAEWAKENEGLTPRNVTPTGCKRVLWNCPNGHLWKSTVAARAQDGKTCPFCRPKSFPGRGEGAKV